MVHWLRHHDFTAEGPSSIPGQGTKISQATWDNQKKKKERWKIRIVNKKEIMSTMGKNKISQSIKYTKKRTKENTIENCHLERKNGGKKAIRENGEGKRNWRVRGEVY